MFKFKKLAAVIAATAMAATMAMNVGADTYVQSTGESTAYGTFIGSTRIQNTSGKVVTVENNIPSLAIAKEIGIKMSITAADTGLLLYSYNPIDYNTFYVGHRATNASLNSLVRVDSTYYVSNGVYTWNAYGKDIVG